MAFTRPTLAELQDRVAADFEAGLPGADARMRRGNLTVLTRVSALAFNSLYGYLAWLADQLMADTAEVGFLDRHATIWEVPRLAAAYAVGNATLTGLSGSVVGAGARLLRTDGQAYLTLADATLVGGTATVAVQAAVAGAAANSTPGTALQFVVPIAGVSSAAVIASGGLAQGADEEDDASLRSRLLKRIQAPPMGGTQTDYVQWALQVAGVTRAWCYPLESGPNNVTVRFMRDDDASPFPDAGAVAVVQAYLDTLRPVCAQVTVAAPVAAPLPLTIALSPNTLAVRQAVQAELADVILRDGVPGGTLLLSHLREAISVAAGEVNHVLSVPTADVSYSANQLPVLGTITWV